MSFQGSINQLLSQGSTLLRLNPDLANKLEMQKLDRASELSKQAHNVEKDLGPMSLDRQQEFAKKNLEIAKAQYELDPTKERYDALQEYQRQFDVGEERLVERDLMAQHRRAKAEAKINLDLEQARIGRELMSNAPKPMTGKKETIKYDNI